MHERGTFHLQHALIGGEIIGVDQAQHDLRMRIADGQFRLRQALRVRPEHDRPCLRRAVGIRDRRLRQGMPNRLDQAVTDRCRPHAQKFHAREIGVRQ